MDMPKPGAAHEKLRRLEGTWSGDEVMHPSPWAPDGKRCQSTVESRMGVDGFFLISDYEQRTGDEVTFRGHAVYGFDAPSERYTMHWFDSIGMDPGAPAYGAWEGDTLTFENDSPMGRGRYRYTINADGSYTFQMSHSQDGASWNVQMDATYTRA